MTTAIAIQPSLLPSGIRHSPTIYPYPRAVREEKSSIRPRPMISNAGPTIAQAQRDRPCDACRKRKARCLMSERQSSCVACGSHGQECTFVQGPQPRKRKVEGEGQEGDIAKKRTSEAGLRPLREFKATPKADIKTEDKYALPNDAGNGQRELPRRVSPLSMQRQSRYIGDTTELEPLFFDLVPFDANGESTTLAGSLRRKGDGPTFIELHDEANDELEANMSVLAELDAIVKPHGPALVDLYFSVIHPSFPVVDEQTFRQEYVHGYNAVSPELLAGVYVVASQWWTEDARLAASQRPDIELLEDMALRLIGDALHRPRLSTVQAGLVIAQRPFGESRELMAQLVNIGYELGLHLDCSTWTMPAWEISLRRRLAWALYMQDKWSSLIYGRPSQISKVNWVVRPLRQDDFPSNAGEAEGDDETGHSEKGWTVYIEMVALTEILSEVLDTFYTLQATREFEDAGGKATRVILERAKPVQIKLKDWFTRLSSLLRVQGNIAGKLSSTGSLHLAYFATEITLHRCIIRSLSTCGADPYLHHICRSAAKTRLISAMEFVNRLKPKQLQAFWYFASKVNFALIGTFGSLLRATAPAREEAEFYRSRLQEYRWTLSVGCKSAPFLNFSVRSLDTSSSFLVNMAEKPSVSTASHSNTTSIQSVSPPRDTTMTDISPPHVGQLPGYFDSSYRTFSQQNGPGGFSSTASGLASPSTSTSTSDGSGSQEAFSAPFSSY